VARTKHVTLVADTVATVNLATNAARIEVVNVDGVAAVYFTTDDSVPTVAGDNTHVLPAAIGAVEVPDETAGQDSVIKLISAGTPKVSVRAL
jgi:hypothetical protein